ncbi:hypothetical protein Gotri_004623 [Gossypium trilobum]|uniref:CP12 domain-containing protein n=1 Tax=Gossypium trilobum TaxID=34281 RepID=A0A7J9F5R6_9ROSI|nr:hypothetical protein [Gossypium trilobum]
MATLRLHSLTATSEKIPKSPFVPSSRVLSASFHCNEKRVSRRMTINAMGGGAKYKGTQMRKKQLSEMIEKKVTEAKEVCEGDETSDECRVAWDEVEEVSQAKANLRLRLEVEKKDPLESFCLENPETEECKVYDD